VQRQTSRASSDTPRTAFLLGLISVVPLLVWWLGWFPGFISSDSVDQLGQAARFEFSDLHPAFHTFTIWLVTRVWDSPGAVTLVQVLAMAGLLALAARRLVQVGVPLWGAVGAAWVVATLPAVSMTTIALWKDVPYTLALLWAFTELLLMARDPAGFWDRRQGPVRLGVAFGLVWLFRHNGNLTVLPMVIALAIGFRRHARGLLTGLAALVAVAFLVPAVLYRAIDVAPATIEPAEVFVSDIAASFTHSPAKFGEDDVALLEAVAPLDVWRDRYDCHDSTPLAFDPEFRTQVIRDRSGEFRSLVVRTLVRDPLTVLGHRWCAASYLFVPPQPADAYFQRPPFEVVPNTLGITRDPVSWRAYEATREVFVWAEADGRLWLTWRPALAVWLGIAAYAGIAWRRGRLLRLLWPGALIGFQVLNVVATTPAQEFRFAFGIYVMCLLSVPLAWLALRPSQAALFPVVVDGGAEHDPGPGVDDGGEVQAGGGEEGAETGAP
jgi:hypothetical protein